MYRLAAQLITSLKSAILAHKRECVVYDGRIVRQILHIFYKEGFVLGYTSQFTKRKTLRVWLRYSPLRLNPLVNMRQISTPSKKVYLTYKELFWKHRYTSFVLVSTSQLGIVKHTDLIRKKNFIGGEIILTLGSSKK